MQHRFFRTLLVTASLLIMGCGVSAQAASNVGRSGNALQDARDAITVLDAIQRAPDHAIPPKVLSQALAIAIVPRTVKAGFLIAARHGNGVLSKRQADGSWSAPVFIDLTGGSVGFQVGISSVDIVLLIRTQKALDAFVNGTFTLGANASVAAGPVGRDAQMMTDTQSQASVYSYSRARGLFAGVSLDGTAITPDQNDNAAVYGPDITPRRILEGGVRHAPAGVQAFRSRLAGIVHGGR